MSYNFKNLSFRISKRFFAVNIINRVTKEKNFLNLIANHVLYYCTPVTLTYSWSFGSLLALYFILQIITGLWLTSYYNPGVAEAFESVIKITHQIKYGSLIRYMHSNGASMLFILLYLHIARGLYFRSFSYSRKSAWITGLFIFLLMMAVAFMGYVLPWGQMSFWGVTVISSFLTVIPFVGKEVQEWLVGGFGVCPTTLTRFYGLHIVVPFVILFLIIAHIGFLHKSGSTSGGQLVVKDDIGLHPYFSVKDIYGTALSFILYGYLIFFSPNKLGHPDNYIPANPSITPSHIVPEWYFTPFYGILRAFPDKTAGVVLMLASIVILAFIPFINLWATVKVEKMAKQQNLENAIVVEYTVWQFKTSVVTLHKFFFWCFIAIFLNLMDIGSQPAEDPFVSASQFYSFLYFSYFVFVIPILPYFDFILLRSQVYKNPIK